MFPPALKIYALSEGRETAYMWSGCVAMVGDQFQEKQS
jgi:hypothetical protein